MKLYLISGLGADSRVFDKLNIQAEVIHIPWEVPMKNESFDEYAKRLSVGIDTSEEFYLGGLSFGGMCAQEMSKFLKPKKLILISTSKGPDEFPPLIRFAFKTKIYKLVPDSVYKRFAFGASRMMGLTGKNASVNFKKMVDGIDQKLFGWSIDKMAGWEGIGEDKSYFHLHSTTDKILPSSNIKNATLVKGGGHLMVLNKAKTVSGYINEYLKD